MTLAVVAISKPVRPAAPKVGDLSALARVMAKLPFPGPDPALRKRQMLAAFCRLLAAQFDETLAVGADSNGAEPPPPANGNGVPHAAEAAAAVTDGRAALSPRLAQTL